MEQMAALGLPQAHTVSPAEARTNAKKRPRAPGPEVAKVEDRIIPGPDGDVPVRIYTPEGEGPFPIPAWDHGGGCVAGAVQSAAAPARHLCARADRLADLLRPHVLHRGQGHCVGRSAAYLALG